jgi:serine/threonine protein kinase/tetratricopeptide (TPR) repeat protein
MTTQRLNQQFGNYRLLSLLGQGGFSEVYLGEHVYLKTQAAIKILTMRLEQDELAHFLSEARIIAHLEHPHIVGVHDFGLEGEKPFLVLSYAPHGSMRQRYPRGSALPVAEIVTYARQISSALQYAHTQNLIHGDVKPENILIGRGEELLLSDFGVAVVASRSSPREDISGTVAYMAPEQLRGEPCFASDQYALGVVVYEWLCGARPFTGSFREIALQHMQAAPPSLRERMPELPAAIERVVMKALAKEPLQRFGSITKFAEALEAAYQSIPASENNTVAVQTNKGEFDHDVDVPEHGNQRTKPDAINRVPTNIPYRRNPYFTGRVEVLERLAVMLRDSAGQPLAISGMGGIGKTELALEYIYRHQPAYGAILWARAESYETLFADFVAIAQALQLTDSHEMDAQQATQAVTLVTRWLAIRRGWLLVFDNIEDYSLMQRFIPPDSKGHILLTTRAQATGTYAQHIELEKLTLEEGARLLLRRSKRLAPGSRANMAAVQKAQDADAGADFIEAQDICKLMDGLPLALDQAGAYIEESGCSLYHYIERFREQRAVLLQQRGAYSALHPQSVSATALLALEKVEPPAAVELLKLCAFLRVDGIHEEIIAGADFLTPVGDDVGHPDMLIAALRKYSLIARQGDERMLSLHRLVQAVIKDCMEADEQRRWAERAVHLVSQVFPAADKVTAWPRCEGLMPQVYVCLRHIEQWQLASPAAARLLDRAGLYLLEQGQYEQAAHLLHKTLDMRETLDPPDAALMETLNNLASCYLFKGEYGRAEVLFARVMALCEAAYGAAHSDVAVTLNNLALLYQQQGKYGEAEQYLRRALTTWEQLEENEHIDFARALNNLALLYHRQGRLSEAEPLYRRGLSIWEAHHGPSHPDLAVQLNNLAQLYQQQGLHAQAEPLFRRVLEIREKTLGPEHPVVAHSLVYLARSYQSQWKYSEAEALFKQALKIRKHALGPEHPEIAHSLVCLAKLYFSQGKHIQAEPLYQQALRIRENALGPEHPDVATLLKNYALLLMGMKRKDEALKLATRAKSIRAKQAALQKS